MPRSLKTPKQNETPGSGRLQRLVRPVWAIPAKRRKAWRKSYSAVASMCETLKLNLHCDGYVLYNVARALCDKDPLSRLGFFRDALEGAGLSCDAIRLSNNELFQLLNAGKPR